MRLGSVLNREAPVFQNASSGVYGILGTGDLSITLEMNDYLDIYPHLYKSKFDTCNSAIAMPQNPFLKQLFEKVEQGELLITVIHERILFTQLNCDILLSNNKDTCSNRILNITNQYSCIAHAYIKKMQEKVDEIDRYQYQMPFETYRYAENIRLIRDLCYTFNDLWFQKEMGINGYIFYTQMFLLVNGIKQRWGIIKGLMDSQNTIAASVKNKDRIIEALCKLLVDTMHQAIIGINNHNKIMQAYNLPSVNTPSYEVQSKVHTEKYLSAYTAYLQMICALFHQEFKSDCTISIPMVSLDINETRVQAYSLFEPVSLYYMGNNIVDEVEGLDEGDKNYKFVSVICPNYQRFANTFHVLPLVTHEISHNFRYIPRKERNDFIVRYVFHKLSLRIIKWLDTTYDGAMGTLQMELVKVIEKQFTDHFKGACTGFRLDKCPMCDLPSLIENYFINVLRISDPTSYSTETANIWTDYEKHFMRLIGIAKLFPMFPDDLCRKPWNLEEVKNVYFSVVYQSICNINNSNCEDAVAKRGDWDHCLNIQKQKKDPTAQQLIEDLKSFLQALNSQVGSSSTEVSIHYLERALVIICDLCYFSIFQEHSKWISSLDCAEPNCMLQDIEKKIKKQSVLKDTDIVLIREKLQDKAKTSRDAQKYIYLTICACN